MKKSRLPILLLLLFVILFFLLGFIFHQQKIIKDLTSNKSKTSLTVKCNEEEAINNTKKAVVKIVGDFVTGSGFVISPDGFVVTNYHVIQNETSPHLVFSDGKSYLGKIHAFDPKIDIAVIKITEDSLPTLEWGNSDELTQGLTVYGLGYPLSGLLKGEVSVNKGAYSARRKSDDGVIEFLQTDTSLNNGNSGGPLIDSCGKVIGVNVGEIQETEGLNFAISQKIAEPLVKTLIENPTIQEQAHSLDYEEGEDLSVLPPVDTVYLFYTYISQRQLEAAYNLLSLDYHKVTTLEGWLKGYENTLNVIVNQIYDTDTIKPSVYVNLTSVDLVGDKTVFKNWEGEWFLIKESEEWKLDDGTIHQID